MTDTTPTTKCVLVDTIRQVVDVRMGVAYEARGLEAHCEMTSSFSKGGRKLVDESVACV